MIDDLPKFERLLLNPQLDEEKEIFYPKWKCFCCEDSGFVQNRLIRMIIPEYDYNQDKNVACQNPSCKKFNEMWGHINIENFDTRFLPTICQKLDLFSREDWHNSVQHQIDVRSLAKKMAISGTVDRTENNNREVQKRKKEIESISHEQWMAIRKEYLLGKQEDSDAA